MDVKKIREDFPVMKKGITYFDNACMTLKPKQVVEKVNEYYREYPACYGRSVHKLSKRVTEEMEHSRKEVSRFLDAKKPEEIVFTKNTTEAINLLSHTLNLKKGDTVLQTDKEHSSNLVPWQVLAQRSGIKRDWVASKKDNTFDMDAFRKQLTPEVKLVSMVHTSNLDGVTVPAEEIIKEAHDNGSLVLLDGAQSAPHRELNMKKLDVDFFACSGHKMCGPTGTGVLYAKEHLLKDLSTFLTGGETVVNSTYGSYELEEIPHKFEAGLQNYAGIIGLGEAVRYLKNTGLKDIRKHEEELTKILTEGLQEAGAKIIGPEPELRGGITSFNIPGMEAHDVAIILDDNNIAVRSGMHCVHSWFNAHNMKGSVRASLYFYNTEEEVREFCKKIKEVAKLGK